MKFYFCEACGQRITEDQIDAGSARDKKLKGVYCAGCAVGVTTLDTLPLTNEDARKLVEQSSDSPSGPERPSPDQPINRKSRTSRTGIKALRRSSGAASVVAPDAERVSARLVPRRSVSRSSAGWLLSLLVVVVIASVAMVALLRSDAPERKKVRDQAAREPGPSAKSEIPQTGANVAEVDRKGTRPTPAAAEWELLQSDLAKLPRTDFEERLKRTEAFVERHPDAAEATRAKEMMAEWRRERPSAPAPHVAGTEKDEGIARQTTSTPKKPAPSDAKATSSDQSGTKAEPSAAIQTPVPPADPTPTPPPMGPLLGKVCEALRTKGIDAALSAIKKSAQPDDTRMEGLRRAVLECKAEDELFVKAIRDRIGKTVRIATAKQHLKGKLIGFEARVLKIEQQFIINGEVKGATQLSVPLADLTAKSRKALYAPPTPKSPDGWAGRALKAVAEERLDDAEASVSSCRDHPLYEDLKAHVARARVSLRERQAQQTFEALAAHSQQKLSLSQLKALKRKLDEYRTAFADTAWLKRQDNAKKFVELAEAVNRQALGLDPRVLKLLRGDVKSYDPRSGEIVVHHDLSRKAHWPQLGSEPVKGRPKKEGIAIRSKGLRLHHAYTWSSHIHFTAFRSGNISVSVRYQDFKHGFYPSHTVGILFCGPGSRGKAPKIRAAFGKKTALLQSGKKLQRLSTAALPGTFPNAGIMEFECRGKQYRLKLDGKVVMEHAASDENDHRGISIGGCLSTFYTVTHIEIRGQLDPRWLEEALTKTSK